MCHGGFDLIHPGHIIHFESAKKLCDVLFVSITSDKFVSINKGGGRPIYTDTLRAYCTASIEFVDYVLISDFRTAVEPIKLLKPDYYIKGPDYIKDSTEIINSERKSVESVGGEILYTKDPKLSTTYIIQYIRRINSGLKS